MAAERIPNEIWVYVFELATVDDTHREVLSTSLDNSSWFKTIFGVWSLQSPEELSITAQKKRYRTIKSILSTCRNWHQIGGEFLFNALELFRPSELHKLCTVLDNEPNLGWWTRRIYLGGPGVTDDDSLKALISVIRHCPNIQTILISWSLTPTGSATIADTLMSFSSKSLHTLSWHISSAALPKTIWALNSLSKSLQSLHLEFEDPDEECNVQLGSAANLTLSLPLLKQLCLRGTFQEFLEQCCEWDMPSLVHVSFDFVQNRNDLPDVVEFLTHHGAHLMFLDLICLQSLDVATILDLCPELITFAFNPDWRLPFTDDFPSTAKLVNRPHPCIKYIGLHQLNYAFGVGVAAAYSEVDPFSTLYIQKSNDHNFAALTKKNFPALQTVRALSRELLRDLESNDGPEKKCIPRWEKWWDHCAKQRVRLEDCTGALLGTLPPKDPPDEEEELLDEYEDYEEEEEEEDEEDDGTWKKQITNGGVGENGVPLSELRALLDECRRMTVSDGEDFNFMDMAQLQSGF